MSTGLLLDGVFASEAIDSSGEILDLKGMDISDFDEGKGVANYEHQGHEDSKNQGQEIVGKIVYAKKIHKEGDCSNDRELMFWRKVRLPFLYGIVRLYDGAGHEGAKALAAIIRDHHANDEPIIVGFSIEGSTLDKDKSTNRLNKTIARRVAMTLKPCNKTAISGLLADPNAPEGFEKNPVRPDLLAMVPSAKNAAKKTETNPLFQRLGGSEMAYGPEITKAMAAGSYAGAPGTLTQGSALQREDKTLKAQVMAAYRDWDRVTPFKKFLKFRLPEVSDDYVDHFSDLVENHHLRVRKAEEVVEDLIKAGKKPLRSPKTMGVAARAQKPVPMSDLTVQAVPVPLSQRYQKGAAGGAFFDENDGSLHTGRGVFQMNTIDRPHPNQVQRLQNQGLDPGAAVAGNFQKALANSRDAHQRAMKHWMPLNEKFRTGKVSPELVSHAILFALMSPGNPVPMQEHMYSHAVDAMHSQGLGAVTSAKQWDKVGRNWLGRNWPAGTPGQLPEHSREYFKRLISAVAPGQGVKGLYTKDGRVQSFGKPQQLFDYYRNYLANHHDNIMDVIRQNPGNAQLVARHLSEAHGFGNKLARYTLGMIGGGNVTVPDTHFLRHTFGLQPDLRGNRPGSSPDNATFTHIRDTATGGARANDIMEGVDRYYLKHHPSVRAVLADPVLGPHFRKHPEQALFPAFWWHWTSVPQHEEMMGTPNASAANSDVDHEPFWAATSGFRKHVQEYDPTLPVKTAMQHHRWVELYGGMPAMKLYMEHLVPKLLANEARGQAGQLMHKFESLGVELRRLAREQVLAKGIHPVVRKPAQKQAQPPAPLEETPEVPALVNYHGASVKPGKLVLGLSPKTGKKMAILHANPKEFHVVPEEKLGGWDESDLLKIPRYTQSGNTDYFVHDFPEAMDEKAVVHSQHHGVQGMINHDDIHSLVHGLDFNAPRQGALSIDTALQSKGSNKSHWQKNAEGKLVYVKPESAESNDFGDPHMESTYHNLARDFFGMGKYLPRVGAVHHPQTGIAHSVIEHVPGDHYNDRDPEHVQKLKALGDSGELDKMSLMNAVMGNMDRHWGNWMVAPDTGVKLIDHDVTQTGPFSGSGHFDFSDVIRTALPNYIENYARASGQDPLTAPLHPAARDWLMKLKPEELVSQLQKHGLPPRNVEWARQRLQSLQRVLTKNPNLSRMETWVHPQIDSNWEQE